MGALYILLPDRREALESVRRANELVHQLDTGVSTERVQLPFTPVAHMTSIKAYRSFGSGVSPDAMLALLRQIDWAYPARVLYRTESENGWSFVTLGLLAARGGAVSAATPEEWPEALQGAFWSAVNAPTYSEARDNTLALADAYAHYLAERLRARSMEIAGYDDAYRHAADFIDPAVSDGY